MSDTLAFTPDRVSGTVRHFGGAQTTLEVRAAARLPGQSFTRSVTLTGAPAFEGEAVLTKLADVPWLLTPATCTDGTPFDITVDGSELPAGEHYESLVATSGEYEPGVLDVSVAVRPQG